MGTQGLFGFKLNNIFYYIHNYYDSYLHGLGKDLIDELIDMLNNNLLDEWITKLKNIKVVHNDMKPTQEDIDILKEYTDISSNDEELIFYILCRGLQGSFKTVLDSGYILVEKEHMKGYNPNIFHSFRIEFTYLLDFDRKTFIVNSSLEYPLDINELPNFKEDELEDLSDYEDFKLDDFSNLNINDDKSKLISVTGNDIMKVKSINDQNNDQLDNCIKSLIIEDGHFITYHNNGKKSVECNYKDGKLDGEYKSWYNNGNKNLEYLYKDGKLDGPFNAWYVNGKLRNSGFYKDGEFHGEYKSWNLYGELHTDRIYDNGKVIKDNDKSKKTEEITRHLNGQIASRKVYKNGKLDGTNSFWYDNGVLSLSIDYKDGLKHGDYYFYNADGSILYKSKYYDDVEDKESAIQFKDALEATKELHSYNHWTRMKMKNNKIEEHIEKENDSGIEMFGADKNIKLLNDNNSSAANIGGNVANNITLDEKYLNKVMKFILESEYSSEEINSSINDKILSYEELIMNIVSNNIYYCDVIRHILAYYKSNSLEESNYINDIIIYTYEWSHDIESDGEISSLSGELSSFSDIDKPLFRMDDIDNLSNESIEDSFCERKYTLDESIFNYNMPSLDDIDNAECVSD